MKQIKVSDKRQRKDFPMKSKIENEVHQAQERLRSVEGTQRLLMRMTFDSLAKAERLRQAARAYQRAFATREEGRARAALFQMLNTLTTSFHKPLPARDMRKVRAFLKGVR